MKTRVCSKTHFVFYFVKQKTKQVSLFHETSLLFCEILLWSEASSFISLPVFFKRKEAAYIFCMFRNWYPDFASLNDASPDDASLVQWVPCTMSPLYNESLVQWVPCMKLPLYDESLVTSLVRCVTCTKFPLFDVSFVPCVPCTASRPLYDASLVSCGPRMMFPWDDVSMEWCVPWMVVP
jgi:hypothetical protein